MKRLEMKQASCKVISQALRVQTTVLFIEVTGKPQKEYLYVCARAHHSFKAKAKSARQGTLYTPKVRQYHSLTAKSV